MTISFILILLIIITGLAIFKRIRACAALMMFTLLCFLAIGNGLAAWLLLKNLQRSFINLPQIEWKKHNAIVLLGAGVVVLPESGEVKPAVMAYSRIKETADRYFSCIRNQKQCTIIISGGDTSKTGKSEALIYQEALLNLGINNSDIKLESNSMNTYQNAQFTGDILKQNQFDQIILVTSATHLLRSLLYFSHFNINAKPAPADYLTPSITALPTGYNFAITDLAIHEYCGIARFYIYNFFGWNK